MQRLYVQEPTERSIRSKKEPYARQIKRNSTHVQNEEKREDTLYKNRRKSAETPCKKTRSEDNCSWTKQNYSKGKHITNKTLKVKKYAKIRNKKIDGRFLNEMKRRMYNEMSKRMYCLGSQEGLRTYHGLQTPTERTHYRFANTYRAKNPTEYPNNERNQQVNNERTVNEPVYSKPSGSAQNVSKY